MSVYDLFVLCQNCDYETEVTVYDETDSPIYHGYWRDLPNEMEGKTVGGFECDTKYSINIYTDLG